MPGPHDAHHTYDKLYIYSAQRLAVMENCPGEDGSSYILLFTPEVSMASTPLAPFELPFFFYNGMIETLFINTGLLLGWNCCTNERSDSTHISHTIRYLGGLKVNMCSLPTWNSPFFFLVILFCPLVTSSHTVFYLLRFSDILKFVQYPNTMEVNKKSYQCTHCAAQN